jgi:hypothetical protein
MLSLKEKEVESRLQDTGCGLILDTGIITFIHAMHYSIVAL